MPRLLHWRSLASLALQFAVLAILIAAFFLRTPQVSGLSMEPQIDSGEYVLINTVAFHFGAPRYGDIVAFRHDGVTPEIFIKRVLGLPGDRIRIEHGNLIRNGVRVEESYVPTVAGRPVDVRDFPEVLVPPSSVYVLGDNRANSEDSRFFGPVAESRLVGKALAGVWPIRAVGAL